MGLQGVCAPEAINYAIRQKGGCGRLVARLAMCGQKERRKRSARKVFGETPHEWHKKKSAERLCPALCVVLPVIDDCGDVLRRGVGALQADLLDAIRQLEQRVASTQQGLRSFVA